tara:strand:+ start:3755 stop:4348 length:594 start_codon:yes stop_codon:yes gene_type:complete
MVELYNYFINNIYQFLGVCFSILYVIFSIRQNILCWPALIIAAAFNIFAYHLIELSLQVFMQIFFIITAIYGWYKWTQPKKSTELKISQWSAKKHIMWISIGIIFTYTNSLILKQLSTNAILYSNYPFLDSLMFTFNIIPMYMTGRKVLESWLYFIVIDIISGIFYITTGEFFFAFLFFCYIGFACSGYITWKKEMT